MWQKEIQTHLRLFLCWECSGPRRVWGEFEFFFVTLCDWRFTQTLFSDSSTGIKCENSLTLIRVFYNYFLTDNPDLHAVSGIGRTLSSHMVWWSHVVLFCWLRLICDLDTPPLAPSINSFFSCLWQIHPYLHNQFSWRASLVIQVEGWPHCTLWCARPQENRHCLRAPHTSQITS